MNKNSRTTNVIRNTLGGVGGQLFTSIFMFICRTYFIKLLGATYLGINGLFSNILSMLSLAELGIGPAIVFSMYKPIAENDEIHIAKLMNFYKNAYRIVAVVVAMIGFCILPFLEFLIKGSPDVENLKIIFILILSNTVISYFYAYKGSMLNADQKAYVVVIFRNVFSVIQNVLQIVVLIVSGSFIIYLITQIITTFLGNFLLALYVDKKYSFLVEYKNEKIDKFERADIMQRVRGMMMHKMGSFVLNSTDNLIISKFIGIITVGIYSNYLMIINLIKTFISQFSTSISASVGNLIASEKSEKSESVFNVILFVHFWIYAFCFACFWVLFEPFILVWIGDGFILDSSVLMFVLLTFYCYGVHRAVDSFTNATGIFWETRWKPIVECSINLVTSILLAIKFGMIGVFIGSVFAYLCTGWVEPWYLYKKTFKKSVKGYMIRYISYLIITIVIALITGFIGSLTSTSNLILNLLVRMILCVLIPNISISILFYKTPEFKGLMQYLNAVIRRK